MASPIKKQIRIVSDGTPAGSHVYNHDGTEITHVRTAWVQLSGEDVATASLEINIPDLDMVVATSDVEIVFCCPLCSDKTTHHCEGFATLGIQRMTGDTE